MNTRVDRIDPLPEVLHLFSRQGGVGAVSQARALGMSRGRLRTLIQQGILRQLAYGVVEVSGSPGTEDKKLWTGLMLAATRTPDLSPQAALYGWTAAWLHDLVEQPPDEVHIISTRRVDNVHDGYVFHRASQLPAHELSEVRGLPVTDPARTFIDVAGMNPWRSISVLRRGMRKGLYDHSMLLRRVEKEARQGRTGVAAARDALMRTHPDAARAKSWLEDHFHELLVGLGYPRPIRNHRIPGSYGHDWEIDLYYPRLRKGIEVSPSHTHSDVHILNKDRRKENDLRLLGIDVVTVTETTTEIEFRKLLEALLGPPPAATSLF